MKSEVSIKDIKGGALGCAALVVAYGVPASCLLYGLLTKLFPYENTGVMIIASGVIAVAVISYLLMIKLLGAMAYEASSRNVSKDISEKFSKY